MKLPPAELAKLPPGRGVNLAALGGDILEDVFQAAVVSLGESAGYSVFHVPDSRRATAGGFPDCVFGWLGEPVAGLPSLLVAELKKDGEKPRANQRPWLKAFELAGVPTFHWTPADWERIERVLRG